MRFLSAVALALTALPAMAQSASWPTDSAAAHAAAFNDPAAWDSVALARDAPYADRLGAVPVPLRIGVFPTPPYRSPGNGNVPLAGTVGETAVRGEAIFVGRGPHNEAAFADSASTAEVYFAILVAVGDSSSGGRSFASSNNHPHYVAEGTMPAEHGRVDWLAVQQADRSALAVVNMRLFDLRFGRVVLAAPQPDGTIRFRQVTAPPLTDESVQPFVKSLLASDEALAFFGRDDRYHIRLLSRGAGGAVLDGRVEGWTEYKRPSLHPSILYKAAGRGTTNCVCTERFGPDLPRSAMIRLARRCARYVVAHFRPTRCTLTASSPYLTRFPTTNVPLPCCSSSSP